MKLGRVIFLLLLLVGSVSVEARNKSSQESLQQGQLLTKGTLVHTSWYSTEEEMFRRVNIYLPAAYDAPAELADSSLQTFPVLYLLHGINGYDGSWVEDGHAIEILEQLVARGDVEPVIIVMPDCNVDPHETKPNSRTLWKNLMHYGQLRRDHHIDHAISELMTLVDTTYRVSGEYAIAGLSDGARIACNVANDNPNLFSVVGLFSPVVHNAQLPCDTCIRSIYYVFVGKRDFFRYSGKRFYRRLMKQAVSSSQTSLVCGRPAAIKHQLSKSEGGHNWNYWRRNLADFLKLWHSTTTMSRPCIDDVNL